ncbi:MAG: tetratricopeptide repeat protein, partial [Saprospiraceae bacterium]|nr:tetratricopeptide repeat protein [Saprospiraceae bacterium]
RVITTSSQEAQDFFNQGIQLKYAFAVNEAISSFREAQLRDPDCAMCYWGEAWALGSYLNGHMRESKAPLALAAIQKASELSSEHANAVERALIDAFQVRYIEDYVYDERRVQDSLFALAMEEVYNAFPDDQDVGTIYGEALMLLKPRRGLHDLEDPEMIRIHEVLAGVLDANIQHPGACHLYIHATESTTNPGLATGCASYLGNTIPGASHIQHMPSHTFNETGEWGKSVRASLQAWHTDQRAEDGSAFAIYPAHNLHMLLYAASWDGQGAIAIQAGKDYAKRQDNNVHLALTLLRFGRFDEILALEDRPDDIVAGSMWDFCHGYAKLKTGEPDIARVYMERVQKTADTTEANFRFWKGAPILKVLAKILEGEILWENGKETAAIRAFERAVTLEDELPYSEPEHYPFAARHWLGAALLEKGRYAHAEAVYRAEVDDHPHNGWSLYGLIAALEAQSKPTDAEQMDFDDSWARADVWLKGSRP